LPVWDSLSPSPYACLSLSLSPPTKKVNEIKPKVRKIKEIKIRTKINEKRIEKNEQHLVDLWFSVRCYKAYM